MLLHVIWQLPFFTFRKTVFFVILLQEWHDKLSSSGNRSVQTSTAGFGYGSTETNVELKRIPAQRHNVVHDRNLRKFSPKSLVAVTTSVLSFWTAPNHSQHWMCFIAHQAKIRCTPESRITNFEYRVIIGDRATVACDSPQRATTLTSSVFPGSPEFPAF